MADVAPTSLTYRPYLDGLRAVAVLLVFVFHANTTFMQGGFIGVDVFFVLSGYLITRILLRQKEQRGTVDLTRFYARRARRLLPAMLIVVSAVVVHEAIWGSILNAATRLREVIATLFYVANWNLIAQADDYFLEGVVASPLRHAWSLAVEEQFYLLFPLTLLVALYLFRRWRIPAPVFVGGLAVVSALLMWGLYAPASVARTYYGTDARAHQLLIGAVLAFAFERWDRTQTRPMLLSRAAAPLGVASLVGLVAMAFIVNGSSPFYFHGGAVLVAVLTAALIAATETAPHSLPAKALSVRPAVQLGKISYGFYLWHWPIILWVAAPLTASFLTRRAFNLAQFALTLAIAGLSYVLVEMPIRRGQWSIAPTGSRPAIATGLMFSVAVAVFAVVALRPPTTADAGRGPEETFLESLASPETELNPTVTAADTAAAAPTAQEEPAAEVSAAPEALDIDVIAAAAVADLSTESCPENPLPCEKYTPQDPNAGTIALIGDSTAQSYGPALKVLAEQYGFRYVHAAVGGCPIGHRLLATGSDGALHKPSNHTCFEEIPSVYQHVLETWAPVAIIATSWNEMNQHIEDDTLVESGTPEHLDSTAGHLAAAADLLTSRQAALVLIDILPSGPSVDCLQSAPSPTTGECAREVPAASPEIPYNEVFHEIAAKHPQVVSITLTDVICPRGSCPLMIDGTVVRYDGGHFTATASRRLAPILADRLAEAGLDLATLSR